MGTVLWFSLAAIRLRAQALPKGVADPKGIRCRAASTGAIGGLRENLRPGLPCLGWHPGVWWDVAPRRPIDLRGAPGNGGEADCGRGVERSRAAAADRLAASG